MKDTITQYHSIYIIPLLATVGGGLVWISWNRVEWGKAHLHEAFVPTIGLDGVC